MRIVLGFSLVFLAGAAIADEYVQGYYRSDGSYVQPHYRSSPNSNLYDNYNSQGNVNPYTGQLGTQPNEYSLPPVYSPYVAPYSNPDRSSGYR